MKKIFSLILCYLLVFTLSSNVFAIEVMPELDLDGADGVDIDLVKYNKNPCYDASTKTLTLNLLDGYETGILNWNSFNLQKGYTLNYGAGTFINNVLSGVTNINGNLNGLNANIYFNALNGAIVGNKANLNVSYFMLSTLPTKETDIADLREKLGKDHTFELEIKDPDSSTRNGILIENNAKISYTNRIDFVSSKIISTNKKDLVSNSPSLVYTTTDGIVFKLEKGAVSSIYSSKGIPAGKDIYIDKKWYVSAYTAPIAPPAPPAVVDPPADPPSNPPEDNSSNPPTNPPTDSIADDLLNPPVSSTHNLQISSDPLASLNRMQRFEELAISSLDKNSIKTSNYLSNPQVRVAFLDNAAITNNLIGSFNKGTISSIVANNGINSLFNAGDLTPISATSKVGNKKGKPSNFDFVIPQAIFK